MMGTRKNGWDGAVRLVLATLLALGWLAALPSAPAGAVSQAFIVTKVADTNDGSCNADCSLREAISAAEGTPDADTIVFAAGIGTTIALTARLPIITRDLTITGPGRDQLTIDGQDTTQLILITSGTVRIAQLGLARGRVTAANGPGVFGGCLAMGGGTVTLADVLVQNCRAINQGGGGIVQGGGSLVIERAEMRDNVAGNSPGFIGGGGAIFVDQYNGPASLTIRDSLIAGNRADNSPGGGIGAFGFADRPGGGMSAYPLAVRIERTTIRDNTAVGDGGGGIAASRATLTLDSSTVVGNTATSYGGGLMVYNGAASGGSASATLTNSTVSGNTAYSGGGLAVYNLNSGNSSASLTNSTVSGNTTVFGGGGLYVYNGTTTGGSANAILTNSVVSGNTVTHGGGGGLAVYNAGTSGSANATLTNSIVNGNTTLNGNGGGLYVTSVYGGSANATLTNSTVSGNRAGTDGGGLLVYAGGTGGGSSATLRFVTLTGNIADNDSNATGSGGGLFRFAAPGATATLSVLSSIVAGNRKGTTAPVASDCFGLVAASSLGRNLWGDQATCPNNGAVGDQNLAALNVPIGGVLNTALANNGGLTQTHALVAGSPAIDKGDNVTCADAPPTGPGGADQRGVARPQGAGCDVGAFEYVATVALTVQTSGAGSVARTPAGGDSGPFGYSPGTVVTLTPQPGVGQTFVGWTVDGVPQGWANPLTITMNGPHTVVATFAPTASFPDVGAGRADFVAVRELASRGTIKGYQDGRYGPDDRVRRDQMAALIARAMPAGPGVPPQTLVPPACLVAGSWDCEVWGNNFSDGAGVDANLWRNAGTMQHYGVSIGYSGATCAAKKVPSPCFGPGDNVTYAQTISFITRAMKAKGYWADQPGAPLPYSNVPSAHQLDVRTFHFYTSALGGVPSAPTTTAGWEAGATRGWFARALWAALDSYWRVDRVP